MNDSELRGYLLGQMSEAAGERLEERLLGDEELFQTLRSVEDDLFDDHARGRLDDSERRQFAERYGEGNERVAFARAFSKRLAGPRIIPFPAPRWIPWAAAAGIALAIGGTLMKSGAAPGPISDAKIPAVESDSTARPATLALTLGTSRSAQRVEAVRLTRANTELRIHLRLDPADRFDEYEVELRSPSGQSIWRARHLSASTDGTEFGLDAIVPAAALAEGPHELAVRGASRGTSPEDLGFVRFGVRRTP